jgi:hypothetical protein
MLYFVWVGCNDGMTAGTEDLGDELACVGCENVISEAYI